MGSINLTGKNFFWWNNPPIILAYFLKELYKFCNDFGIKWVFWKQFRYLYLLSTRHNNLVAMSLSDVALKLSYSCDGNVRRQGRLIMTSLHETLQKRRFRDVVQRFRCNYMETLEWRQIALSQQCCNNIIVPTGWMGRIRNKFQSIRKIPTTASI